jgi:hypothetical protein
VGEPAKKERLESEAVKQKSTVLIAQVSWCAHAWNATPEEAAQQVVADLFDLLARGGRVSVHVTDLSGKEHTIEVTAGGVKSVCLTEARLGPSKAKVWCTRPANTDRDRTC